MTRLQRLYPGQAAEVARRLAGAGIDPDDVGLAQEDRGVAGSQAFQDMLAGLAARAHQSSGR